MDWARAAGCKTLSNNHKKLRSTLPSAAIYNDDGKISTKRTIVIPDATTCDNRNVTTAYDVKITAPTARDSLFPGSAAARGEKQKQKHYDQHKQKCHSQGMVDSRLNIEVIPIVFESPGAAGRHMVNLAHRLSRHFEDSCTLAASRSDIALFNTKWTHRISTQLQIYNAKMIHYIGTHRRPKNTARPTKPDTIETRPKTKQDTLSNTRTQKEQKTSRETTTNGLPIRSPHPGSTRRGSRRQRSGKKTAPLPTQSPTTTDKHKTARNHKGPSSPKKSTAPQGAPCLPTTTRCSPSATNYVSYLLYQSAEA